MVYKERGPAHLGFWNPPCVGPLRQNIGPVCFCGLGPSAPDRWVDPRNRSTNSKFSYSYAVDCKALRLIYFVWISLSLSI